MKWYPLFHKMVHYVFNLISYLYYLEPGTTNLIHTIVTETLGPEDLKLHSFEITMEELIQIVRQSIEKVCSKLNASNDIDFDDVLTTVELLVDAISFLDSVASLPEDIYSDVLAARRAIEGASKIARVPLT